MSSRPPAGAMRLDLEITIISGKNLKNVNWKNGELKPYAIFWVDPDHKLTTKSDDSGNTKPVWNQRFLLPITTSPLSDASLSLEIFHSKASDTPKPFVGSLQVWLSNLPEPDNPSKIRTFDLLRSSGRPQGKIRLKLAIKEVPLPPPPLPAASDYQNAPSSSYYYSSSAPPYPYTSRSASPATAYPYSMGYYSGYYPPPPPPPRPFSDRPVSYGAPSAPVDYTPHQYEPHRSRVGLGTGLAVGAVAGALGGLALGEGLKYEEEKIAERVEDNLASRDDFSEYHVDY